MTSKTTKHSHIAAQYGSDFYDVKTGLAIAHYPSLVQDDFDMAGAVHARRVFLREHPSYEMETPRDFGQRIGGTAHHGKY